MIEFQLLYRSMQLHNFQSGCSQGVSGKRMYTDRGSFLLNLFM